MKGIVIDREKSEYVTGKVSVREKTGVNPEEVNEVVNGLICFLDEVKKADARLKEIFSVPDEFDLMSFENDYEKALREFQNALLSRLVWLYKDRCLPNATINEEQILKDMRTKVGRTGFDATVVDDAFAHLNSASDPISLGNLLRDARRILPYLGDSAKCPTTEDKVKKIQGGRWLRLRVYMQKLKLSNRFEYTISAPYMGYVSALGKLSRIALLGESPVTVCSKIGARVPMGYQAAGQFKQKFEVDEAVKSIRFHQNGHFLVEYASEMDARKVAEMLVDKEKYPDEDTRQAKLNADN